jgi:hypothetical protein
LILPQFQLTARKSTGFAFGTRAVRKEVVEDIQQYNIAPENQWNREMGTLRLTRCSKMKMEARFFTRRVQPV